VVSDRDRKYEEGRAAELLLDEMIVGLRQIAHEAEQDGSWARYEAVFYAHDWDLPALVAPAQQLADDFDRLPALRDLLSAAKQWRHATQQRLRHLNSRNEAVALPVDQALFEAIDKAEEKT
jgi:hypothetical protein